MTNNDDSSLNVSRRSFISAAGVGVLGLAYSGLLGCSSDSKSAETTEASEVGKQPSAGQAPDASIEVEVCVVGAGPAGITAAIQAVEMGAEVMVVDINTSPTGNGHSISVCDTEYQHELGPVETPEEFVEFLTHYEDNPNTNTDLALLLARNSSETVDWLTSHGVEFSGVAAADPEPFERPRILTTIHGRDAKKAFVDPLEESAIDLGVQFMFETEATNLILDDSGAVKGVEALGLNGQKTTINAKSVILATGGYATDDELLRKYAPKIPNCGALDGAGIWSRGTGFALRQGLKIGAEIISGGGHLMYKNLEGANADHAGMALHIGIDGRRFCDESINRLDRAAVAADLGLTEVFIIYDSELPSTLFTGTSSSGGSATTSGDGSVDDALQAALDEGTVHKADSIGELARKLGIKTVNLEETVETYNSHCDSGVDEEFGKPFEKTALILDPEREDPNDTDQIEKELQLLNKVSTPPFYATRCFINSYQLPSTFGGLVINEKAEVLDVDGNPISNLFSGGEASNGAVLGRVYVTSGMQMMNAFGFGRVAGKSAAENASG